ARRFFEHPLAQAAVQAGQPTVAIDVSAEPFLFDDYLVKKPADTVVVPVQGDSMIEAGIFEGDLAVVERTASAKLGSFVVAQVEDRFTLKELVKVDGAHALKAHNRRYPLIRPEGVWHIFGVMVGLVRRY
ncbi:MAG: LexA family protein, partial [Polaromonas sp.]